MPVGESSWLRGKVPVKFVRYSLGGFLHKSGWYFFNGPYRFTLKTSRLRKLFQTGKAALVVDEETVRELAMKYRGVKEKKTEQPTDPRVVRLEEFKRQREEAARKAAEDAVRQKKMAEREKRLAERRQRLAEKARKKLESARKTA